MLVFLYGEDKYRIHEELLSLRKQFFCEKKEGVELRKLDIEEIEESKKVLAFLEGVRGGNLFASRIFVQISGLFSLKKEVSDAIVEYIQEMNFTSDDVYVVVITTTSIDKRLRLYKELVKKAHKKEEFQFLKEVSLKQWVKTYIRKTYPEITFEESALNEIVRRTQGDLFWFTNEVEKIFFGSKEKGKITKEDVEMLMIEVGDSLIFSLLDTLGSKNVSQTFFLVKDQYLQGKNSAYLLPMFAFAVRSIIKVLSFYEEKHIYNKNEIASQTKIHPFVVEKIIKNKSTISLLRAKRMLTLLSRLDIATKTGKIDPDFAVEEFIFHA
ncbi:MAG: DNA polymerase III subunit delta [Candidatus Moranbacteria bacterium]|nr:DNA polymerase III subunit delta [Candidatus Moranbacteria bacterium]